MERSTTPTSGLLVAPPELSPLEQEVLDEYERLAENMKKVRSSNPALPSPHPPQSYQVSVLRKHLFIAFVYTKKKS
jgi:hypothetical protein